MSQDFYCKVSIINNSSKLDLKNSVPTNEWGKWADSNGNGTNPPTNILHGSSASCQLTGREGSSSGAEGGVGYTVWQDGADGEGEADGLISFAFSCPYAEDNTASVDNTSDLTVNFCCRTSTGDDWGAEAAVPPGGHPLYVQYTLTD